jgi:pimeloyl-ACP methyl ester carboxylesterase
MTECSPSSGKLSAMAKIVLVHGAFNELWGPNELKSRWLPALRDGLWHHGVEVDDADVTVCFYGDLFRGDPETEESPAVAKAKADISKSLGDLGDDLLSTIHMAANTAAFERTVDMVATMVATPDLTERIRGRFDDVLGDDTRVVVAHSLGTVVAYRALANGLDRNVHTFVTLGSPLGSPMVFDGLVPAPVDGVGAWPGGVERWVNIAAVGDKAAEASRLSDRFGPRVEDRLVDNGHRAHDPEPYLNNAVTGRVVADAIAEP